jgi:choline-sulfatase
MALTRRELLAAPALHLAAASRQPNILLVFPDQHRFDWTGLNRVLPVKTPHLSALASRGVAFRNAIVASPLCAPSRACLASGREYDRCGVPSNQADYPLSQTTFYSLLRGSGYHVMACGKVDLHKATQDWGLDGKRLLKDWGFSDGIDNAGKMDAIASGAAAPRDPYMAYLHERKLAAAHVADFRARAKEGYKATYPTPLDDAAYCDNWIGDNARRLIDSVPSGKPWFLQVNFTGPHNPMDITRSMESRCRNRMYPQPNRPQQFTPEEHVAIRQNYTAMVENIDRWLGTFIEQLRKRGEFDNTLVVFSSDHGEMLGDHGKWGKTLPYQQSIGVPLVIAGPGVAKGAVSDALVSHIDLAATFLESAGLVAPQDMDSRSLTQLLAGRAKKHREVLLSGLGQWRLAYDGRWKLITGFDPAGPKGAEGREPVLFDRANDPLENENLAAKAPKELERLMRYLRS